MSIATENNAAVTLSHALTFDTVVQMHPISSDLCVYRVAQSVSGEVPAYLKNLAKTGVVEGIATIKEVRKFQNGKSAKIDAVSHACFASQNFLDSAQKLGYPYAADKFSNELRIDVFTCIVDEGGSPDLLTISDYGSHMLYTLSGEVRPTAIHFDYMSGSMHNVHVDLEGALKLLSSDPRVTFVGERSRTEEKPKIVPIPYYNADGGRSEFLSFYFAPSFAEMQELWAKMKSYGTQYPSTQRHRAMEDLDMLGLAKAGLIKPEVEEQGQLPHPKR